MKKLLSLLALVSFFTTTFPMQSNTKEKKPTSPTISVGNDEASIDLNGDGNPEISVGNTEVSFDLDSDGITDVTIKTETLRKIIVRSIIIYGALVGIDIAANAIQEYLNLDDIYGYEAWTFIAWNMNIISEKIPALFNIIVSFVVEYLNKANTNKL